MIVKGHYWQICYVTVTWLPMMAGYQCKFGTSDTLSPGVGESGAIYSHNYPNDYPSMQAYCEVNFWVCEGCTLQLNFDDVRLGHCANTTLLIQHSDTCSHLCEYFLWTEQNKTSHPLFDTLDNVVMKSNASTPVTLRFCYSDSAESSPPPHRWRLSFYVADTYSYRISGTARRDAIAFAPDEGIIRSVGFPDVYPSNTTSYTYLIEGFSSSDRIHIAFDDFDINPKTGLLKIYDGALRKNRSTSFHRFHERPFFTSSSRYLLIEFTSGSPGGGTSGTQTYVGFKATYQFVDEKDVSKLPDIVHQGCMQKKSDVAGVVEHHGLNSGPQLYYDCVWSLPALHSLRLAVKILRFNIKQGDSSRQSKLEVRDGPHSDGRRLAELVSAIQLQTLPSAGYTSKRGFYLRLRAWMTDQDSIQFSFVQFKELNQNYQDHDCWLRVAGQPRAGFLCSATHRCIPKYLICDKTDHCGDGQDEAEQLCKHDAVTVRPVRCAIFRCPDGTCVRTKAFCPPVQSRPEDDCSIQMKHYCSTPGRCYTDQQKCDGEDDCQDGTDEKYCEHAVQPRDKDSLKVLARSLGHTWFFFLPALLLILAFVAGCLIYKTKRFTHSREQQSSCIRQAEHIQLHTFVGRDELVEDSPGVTTSLHTPPPCYEDVVTPRPYSSPLSDLMEREPLLPDSPPETPLVPRTSTATPEV